MAKEFPIKVVADKELRRKRVGICADCPFNQKDLLCTKCGCVLPAKITLVKSRCPLGKW